MHVGRELRAARELQGLSLDELSARTKISLERLKAIENEDVDSLPPHVHLKGFIHAYAAEVGLDPIATTQLYLHRIERDALAEFNAEDAEDVFAEAPRSGEDDGPLTVTLSDSSIESRVIARLAQESEYEQLPPERTWGDAASSATDADHFDMVEGDLLLRHAGGERGEIRDGVRGRPTAWRLALAAGMTTVIALSVWAMLLLVSNRNEVAQAPLTVTGQERSAVEETPPAAQSSHQASSNPPEAALTPGAPTSQAPPDRATTKPATAARDGSSRSRTTANATTPANEGIPPKREAPAAKLTGEWAFTNQIESSRVPVFKGLTLGFRLRLVQDGTAVRGAGVKVAENGRRLTRRQQTPITLQGELEGNRLELTFSERGRRRTSNGALVMHLLDDRSMSGRFSSDAAGSRGTSHALRIVSR
jgi:cytoskeletal protein RodZ